MNKNILPIEGTPDSFLVLNVLDDPANALDYLKTLLTPECDLNKSKPCIMFFGLKDSETNSIPYLRCPSIREVKEFTPEIRNIANTIDPSVNIIKIVRYKDGSKSLKNHSDKTIDLDDTLPIYNIRLGSPRKFMLHHKTNGTLITTIVPNNAMFILGLKTNSEYTHSVPEEIEVTDCTYSIVLRKSVTFKTIESYYLWGSRTPFPLYTDLKEYLAKNDAELKNSDKTELIKLWHIENHCTVGNDHYVKYSTTTAAKIES